MSDNITDHIVGFNNRLTNFLVQYDQKKAVLLLATAAEKTKEDVRISASARLAAGGAYFATLLDPIAYPFVGAWKLLSAVYIMNGSYEFDKARAKEGLKNIFVSPFLATVLNVYIFCITILGLIPANKVYPYFFTPIRSSSCDDLSILQDVRALVMEKRKEQPVYLNSQNTIRAQKTEIYDVFVNESTQIHINEDDNIELSVSEQLSITKMRHERLSLNQIGGTFWNINENVREKVKKIINSIDITMVFEVKSFLDENDENFQQIYDCLENFRLLSMDSKTIFKKFLALSQDAITSIEKKIVLEKFEKDIEAVAISRGFFADIERKYDLKIGEKFYPNLFDIEDKYPLIIERVNALVDYLNTNCDREIKSYSENQGGRNSKGHKYANILFYMIFQVLSADPAKIAQDKFKTIISGEVGKDWLISGSGDLDFEIQCKDKNLHIVNKETYTGIQISTNRTPLGVAKTRREIIIPFSDLDAYLEAEKNGTPLVKDKIFPNLKDVVKCEYSAMGSGK